MNRLTIGHVGLHVQNIEEEVEFLKIIGAELTSVGKFPNGRLGYVSLDGVQHHSLALFEDGEPLPAGDSKKERAGLHHIALPAQSRAEVDAYGEELRACGIEIDGPYINGPEGGRQQDGSRSYSIFFTDPNGNCFEIYAGALTLPEFRKIQPESS